MKKTGMAFVVFIFVVIISACVESGQQAGRSDLEGITWVLTAINENRPIAETKLTIKFEDGQVSGTTGCNHYGGSYQIKGDAITFSDLESTEMACMEPEGVMEQERVYLDQLGTTQRFEMIDDVLVIFTGPGQKLIFVMQQDTPEPQGGSLDQHGSSSVTTTAEVVEPLPPNTLPFPVGYKEYQDTVVGVSVHIPGNWNE